MADNTRGAAISVQHAFAAASARQSRQNPVRSVGGRSLKASLPAEFSTCARWRRPAAGLRCIGKGFQCVITHDEIEYAGKEFRVGGRGSKVFRPIPPLGQEHP